MSCAPHAGDVIADYVDGLLSAPEQLQVERHLVACEHCRARVEQERELIGRLREVHLDVGRHQQLMAGLLSLAGDEPRRGQQPVAVADARPAPAMVTAHAPAQYLSARRSVAFTLVAVAGCLGAALTVSQVPTGGAPGGGYGHPGARAAYIHSAPTRPVTPVEVHAPDRFGITTTTTTVSSINESVPGR